MVMLDRDESRWKVSAEVEKKLELQRAGGAKFFVDMIRRVVKESIEKMERENEEENDELSDKSEN